MGIMEFDVASLASDGTSHGDKVKHHPFPLHINKTLYRTNGDQPLVLVIQPGISLSFYASISIFPS